MPSFTYTIGKPAGNQTPSSQRSEMQTNNDSNAGIWDVDHFGFNDITNGGYHEKMTIPIPTSPAPAPVGTQGIVTSQTSSGKSELYYTNTTSNVQLTNTSLVASSGQSMIPGGMQIRTGSFSFTPNNTNQIVSISPAFSSGILIALAIPDSSDQTHVIQFILGSSSASQAVFKSANGGSAFTIRWVAIGY